MKYSWQNLEKPLSCFTTRSATMRDLNTNKIIQHYSANTKIVVVQKCVTPVATYYRTEPAKLNRLNYAFEASAFGLPNEPAPLEHSLLSNSLNKGSVGHATQRNKTNRIQDENRPKSGAGRFLKRLFRRHDV